MKKSLSISAIHNQQHKQPFKSKTNLHSLISTKEEQSSSNLITDKILNRHNSNDLNDVSFDIEAPINITDLKGTAHVDIEDY